MGQDVYRYRPRENEQINKSWMCDQGRLSYKQLNQHRVLRGGGRPRPRRASEAAQAGGGEVRGAEAQAPTRAASRSMVSPVASNEDLLAALAFARDVLKVKAVYVSGRPIGQGDHFLMTADKNPNRKGLECDRQGPRPRAQAVRRARGRHRQRPVKAPVGFGDEVPERRGGVRGQAPEKLELLVVAGHQRVEAHRAGARGAAPPSTHVEDEGSFTQEDGITQRFRRAYPPKGDSQPHWSGRSQLATRAGHARLKPTHLARRLQGARAERARAGQLRVGQAGADEPGEAGHRHPAPPPPTAGPPGWREQGVPQHPRTLAAEGDLTMRLHQGHRSASASSSAPSSALMPPRLRAAAGVAWKARRCTEPGGSAGVEPPRRPSSS